MLAQWALMLGFLPGAIFVRHWSAKFAAFTVGFNLALILMVSFQPDWAVARFEAKVIERLNAQQPHGASGVAK